nr:hypothetical protein [Grimontia sedimenti]
MRENIGALNVTMTPDVVSHLSTLIHDDLVVGERYSEGQMKVMDSERDRD